MLFVLFNRFLGKDQSHRPALQKLQSPEQWVERIQQGDLLMRNQFITDYQPYVAKVTSKFCKRYVDPALDDEFNIALTAFDEAINQFSATAGSSFLGFSETVMRRRLIDYVRKEVKHSKHVPYSSFVIEDEDNGLDNRFETQQALDMYDQQQAAEERRNEIIELSRCLAEFGIEFMDLAASSPRHADSREKLVAIGKILANNMVWMNHLLSKHTLPIKEMLNITDVSRKTLERNRKFIMTVALIHHGLYPYLREYLTPAKPIVEGGRQA